MRELIVRCDAAHDGKRPEASIIDVLIRVTDPSDPAAAMTVAGTIEACPEHGQPVGALADLIAAHGAKLDDDARQGLASVLNGKQAPEDKPERVICHTCPEGKRRPILAGSTYTHAKKMHNRVASSCDFRPLVVA